MRIHWFDLVILTVAAHIGDIAFASDCFSRASTLAEDYARAKAIIVAQATGCADGDPSGGDRCQGDAYFLVALEVLKNSPWMRSHGGVITVKPRSECAPVIRTDQRYLVFLDDLGEVIGPASGHLGSAEAKSASNEERLNRLREYRDHVVEDLSEPWVFGDTGAECTLRHSFFVEDSFSAGSLAFTYRYSQNYYDGSNRLLVQSRGPAGEYRLDSGPDVPPGESQHFEMTGLPTGPQIADFSISLGDFKAVAGSVSVKVGQRSWALARRSIVVRLGTSGTTVAGPIVVEAATGIVARDILEAMVAPSEVIISAQAIGIGPEPLPEAPVRFTTRTTRLPAAATDFVACVDGARRQPNPALP